MLPPRSIDARTVVQVGLLIDDLGVTRALRRLERAEPALAGFVMEEVGELYAELDRACASYDDVLALHRKTVELVLVSIEAVRRSS